MDENKDVWENGHELIDNMPKKNNPWWGIDDLAQYIRDGVESPYLEFVDPKHYKHCAHLDGWFTIAELDAIVIALMNDRGRFEAS